MTEPLKIYRFLPARWALKAIQEKRLRISRLPDLNDPFEWHIGVKSIDQYHHSLGRKAIDNFLERLNEKFGIICFSKRATDPTIWSHYTESHKGIALEFSAVSIESLVEVKYLDELPIFDVDELTKSGYSKEYTKSVLEKAFGRKSPSWEYERECRVHYDLSSDDCYMDGKHYFAEISENFLKRVILGINCPVSVNDVRALLKTHDALISNGLWH
jgi:hypothetical protein